jgi:hypothetical protein
VPEETQDASQTDWEGEGGATKPEPKQTTPKGLEVPVPSRKSIFAAFKKITKPKQPHG